LTKGFNSIYSYNVPALRILYMVPYAPTPIRTRPYHLLKQLVQDGHELTLATCYTGTTEQESLAQWRAVGINLLAAPLTRQRSLWNTTHVLAKNVPLQAAFCWQPALMRQMRQAMDNIPYDVIHIEHLRGAWYGIAAQKHLKQMKRATPVVWDSVDCISHLFAQASQSSITRTSRWMTRFELGRTRTYEKKLAQTFARTLVVSETERAAFCEILASDCANVSVIPNGVALDTFVPGTSAREPATILLTGKMSYHANVTAAFFLLDEIMPRVWQQLPHARVCIAGQNPPTTLLQRATPQIEITGTVPDLRPYIHRATVACAPIRYGAGTQNKVLEAMACGTAVVATPQAIDALHARPDQDLLLGTTPDALSAQLVRVCTDDALRAQLECNGRRYVETYHQWANSTRVLTDLYAQAHQDTHAVGV
jgi:polysaccharide biosynthesis protein PslH